MNPVLYFIDDEAAALVLRQRLGGSIKFWREWLAKDRLLATPTIPFEGLPEAARYAKNAVYEYVLDCLAEHADRLVDWSVSPEFDHEVGYPRVYVSLCRGGTSLWAVLDPDVAKTFASELMEMADVLTGMTFEQGRRLLAGYGAVHAMAPAPADSTAAETVGAREAPCTSEPGNEEYIESDEPVLDPEWVAAERSRLAAGHGEQPEGEEYYVG